MKIQYTDIGINLTNKQFQNETETIIQNAIDAEVSKMILTGTSICNSEQSAVFAKKYTNILCATAGINATILSLTTSYQKQYKCH